MGGTWLQQIVWSRPHSVSELTTGSRGRKVIPDDRGFYAFVEGCRRPSPDYCLYLGIAVGARGLYGRLGSYLRATVTAQGAAAMKHRGKKLISFARIRGVDGSGSGNVNTRANDKFIHVCWATVPLDFSAGRRAVNEREVAFMLERALIDYYRPLYNTADWERDLELELDEDPMEP